MYVYIYIYISIYIYIYIYIYMMPLIGIISFALKQKREEVHIEHIFYKQPESFWTCNKEPCVNVLFMLYQR